MRRCLGFIFSLVALPLFAEVTSAEWSTYPSAPLYVGQSYQLCLTLETRAEEEITNFRLDHPSNQQVLASVEGLKAVASHTTEVFEHRRVTKLFFEPTEARTLGTLAVGALRAEVTLTQRVSQGFFTSVHSTSQGVAIPAASFAIETLAPEAQDLAVGRFEAQLVVEPMSVKAGGVVQVMVICEAIEGFLPEDYLPALEVPQGCKLYPGQVLERSEKHISVRFYCVSTAAPSQRIALAPMTYFDTQHRAVRTLVAEACVLKVEPPKTARDEVTLPSGERVYPLRYAPSEKAPMIGSIPCESDPSSFEVLAQEGQWRCVKVKGQMGWLYLRAESTGERQ